MDNYISEIYVFIIAGILLFGILAGFIVSFVITYYKKQQENAKEKHQLQIKFNEDLLTSTIEIQERAFDDISRELHDNIGQQLSAVSIYLNLLLRDKEHQQDQRLQSCSEIISSSLQDLRQLTQTLLGEKITTSGLVQSLKLQVERINKLGICKASFSCNTDTVELDTRKSVILFRIIQEAISNASKHGPGCSIIIKINQFPHTLHISIEDNGPGFRLYPGQEQGIGLINMKSRANTIGANYQLDSVPGRGTRIDIVLPAENLH